MKLQFLSLVVLNFHSEKKSCVTFSKEIDVKSIYDMALYYLLNKNVVYILIIKHENKQKKASKNANERRKKPINSKQITDDNKLFSPASSYIFRSQTWMLVVGAESTTKQPPVHAPTVKK